MTFVIDFQNFEQNRLLSHFLFHVCSHCLPHLILFPPHLSLISTNGEAAFSSKGSRRQSSSLFYHLSNGFLWLILQVLITFFY